MLSYGKQSAFLVVLLVKSFQTLACPDLCECSVGKVDCNGKHFYFIPETMDHETDSILLAFNEISSVQSMAFSAFHLLTHLELQNNLLSRIHRNGFHGLRNLSYLDLSSNRLTSITPDVFTPLSRLAKLNLGNNRLSRLPVNILLPLVHLQSLYLYNNALNGLQVEFLTCAPALTELRLDGNPWACTCQIQHMVSWMIEKRQIMKETNRTLCESPRSLNHFPVLEITRESFRRCRDYIPLSDYLYILLTGIALFTSSIVLCFLAGSLTVCYERVLISIRQRPRVYKPAKTQENIIIANPSTGWVI
ncbi:leucine-rich repeat-containing protein 26 [Pelobates fuscus]|uniref:leucine-rich repeat-containing protein 26 n=1 Tax=Pelobates fuscus TaxID=191477 RepID=UPI002FE4C011